MLAFVIPLRHPDSSRNWAGVVARLKETLRSVAACSRAGRAFGVLVANSGAELPPVPESVTVVRVDYPAPTASVFRGEGDEDERKRVVHIDKGSKVVAGAIRARELGARYLMCVDADDLVSTRLPEFVASHDGAPGWRVSDGWLLPVGGRMALRLRDFDQWCGTSAITRIDLLELGDDAAQMEPERIRSWFGHHRDLIPDLERRGHRIESVPFTAAVYRTGHPESNYRRGTLVDEAFSLRKIRRKPLTVLKRTRQVRWFTRRLVSEFHDGVRLV